MKTLFLVVQIILSIGLTTLIILQNSQENKGTNLSLVKPRFARRGIEKFIFVLTIALLIFFLVSSFIQLLI